MTLVTLDKSHNQMDQFLPLQNGDSDSTYLIGLL